MNKIDSSSWSEIKSLDERLAREPDSFCFAELSELYLKVGLAADALHTARQGVEKHPGYLAGLRALAMACNANGLHEESINLLEQVTAALPADTDAQALLAGLYAETGDKSSAIRVYTALLEFNPDDVQSKARLEELQLADSGEPRQVEMPSEPAGSGDEYSSDAAEEEIYELSEDEIFYDDEEEDVEPVAPPVADVFFPVHHDPLSTQTLAELYEQQGFIGKALDIYRTVLADDPDNVQLQAKIAALEIRDSASQSVPEHHVIPDLDDEQEPSVSASLGDVPAPLDSQAFSPLAHQTADNVLGTLDSWLENIRRIKACR